MIKQSFSSCFRNKKQSDGFEREVRYGEKIGQRVKVVIDLGEKRAVKRLLQKRRRESFR